MAAQKSEPRNAIRCRIRTCGRTFLGASYNETRPYAEVWEHIKNMHGHLLLEETSIVAQDTKASETDEIPF